MNKSKRKHENPFENHLWQTEHVLWMGKPSGQRWRYGRQLPTHYLSNQGERRREILTHFVGLIMCAFCIRSALVQDFVSLFCGILMLSLSIPIATFLSALLAEENVHYAITNRRVLVLREGRCHELLHELILKVRVEGHGQAQSIQWDEGQVGFFPSFVGIQDAEYLVQLVEDARGEMIPIVHKMWRGMTVSVPA